jgi:phosphate transport system protein
MMTRARYDEELDTLRSLLLKMGNQVDEMVAKAIEALMRHDVRVAEEVLANDDLVDSLDIQIETQCIHLIALQQPMARDLRLIGAVLKIITDLERIGDHAVDIAKETRKLARTSFNKPLVDLPGMTGMVRGMLHDAMAAFVTHDLNLVDRVVDADDEVDDVFHRVRSELHTAMEHNPNLVVHASYLLFVAHYLERTADHAVNIAERVHYVETSSLTQLSKSHKSAARNAA